MSLNGEDMLSDALAALGVSSRLVRQSQNPGFAPNVVIPVALRTKDVSNLSGELAANRAGLSIAFEGISMVNEHKEEDDEYYNRRFLGIVPDDDDEPVHTTEVESDHDSDDEYHDNESETAEIVQNPMSELPEELVEQLEMRALREIQEGYLLSIGEAMRCDATVFTGTGTMERLRQRGEIDRDGNQILAPAPAPAAPVYDIFDLFTTPSTSGDHTDSDSTTRGTAALRSVFAATHARCSPLASRLVALFCARTVHDARGLALSRTQVKEGVQVLNRGVAASHLKNATEKLRPVDERVFDSCAGGSLAQALLALAVAVQGHVDAVQCGRATLADAKTGDLPTAVCALLIKAVFATTLSSQETLSLLESILSSIYYIFQRANPENAPVDDKNDELASATSVSPHSVPHTRLLLSLPAWLYCNSLHLPLAMALAVRHLRAVVGSSSGVDNSADAGFSSLADEMVKFRSQMMSRLPLHITGPFLVAALTAGKNDEPVDNAAVKETNSTGEPLASCPTLPLWIYSHAHASPLEPLTPVHGGAADATASATEASAHSTAVRACADQGICLIGGAAADVTNQLKMLDLSNLDTLMALSKAAGAVREQREHDESIRNHGSDATRAGESSRNNGTSEESLTFSGKKILPFVQHIAGVMSPLRALTEYRAHVSAVDERDTLEESGQYILLNEVLDCLEV